MDNINIGKIKSQIIEKALDKIVINANSDTERELKKEELKNKINSNTLITDISTLSDEIKSEELNNLFNEMYIDMYTSFSVSNNMIENANRYETNYKYQVEYLENKMNAIISKLDSCRNSISNAQMPTYVYEDFKSSDSFNLVRGVQKDRYGQYLSSSSYVDHIKEGGIRLPLIRRDNTLRYDDKVETGKLLVNFQLGRGFLSRESKNISTENAIDNSKNTFWTENILADAPFKVSFKKNKPDKLYVNDEYYYDVENGALCELEINFESVNTVNEVSLSPCCKYPIDIVAIRYKLTDDQDEELKELVTPDNIDISLRSKTIDGDISYRFPDILCKKIYIVFVQEHYERNTYVYRKKDVYNNNIWFDSRNDKRSKNKNALFKPNYSDRDLSNPLWNNINDKILKNDVDDISSIILAEDNDVRKIIKYEYQYGFYNIGCFNNHFDRTGFYISKPIKIASNVKSLKINTIEEHPRSYNGETITDIEYYISSNINPSEDDWIPIIPENKDIIESELLFITAETRAYLRFQAEEVISIKKNGEPIEENINEYHLEKDPRTGKVYCVQIFNYDFDAVYSISYIPVKGHTIIDLSNKITTGIETFKCSKDTIIKLKNNVFIDKDYEYCSIKIIDSSDKDKLIEVEAKNVTDLITPTNGFLNFDKLDSTYQFYVNEKSIYFNKPLPENCIIDVSYKHLFDSIMIKALLRRNSTKDVWNTPVLKKIEYNIETI